MTAIEEALNVLERSGGEPGDVEKAREELRMIRRMLFALSSPLFVKPEDLLAAQEWARANGRSP